MLPVKALPPLFLPSSSPSSSPLPPSSCRVPHPPELSAVCPIFRGALGQFSPTMCWTGIFFSRSSGDGGQTHGTFCHDVCSLYILFFLPPAQLNSLPQVFYICANILFMEMRKIHNLTHEVCRESGRRRRKSRRLETDALAPRVSLRVSSFLRLLINTWMSRPG